MTSTRRSQDDIPTMHTPKAPLSRLFAIPVLDWEREGIVTAASGQARLLDTLALILERLDGDPPQLKNVTLSGQMVLIEDLLRLRPDILRALIKPNKKGRIDVGPWYVDVDETLVSGEALIRNLLAGRATAERYNLRINPIAYSPARGGHIGQLPQILNAFGISAIFMQHGASMVHLPFRWQGMDGSSLLVISHDTVGAAIDNSTVANSVAEQKMFKPDGPYLWLMPAVGDLIIPPDANIPVSQGPLAAYVAGVRMSMPDNLRPALHGELWMQGKRPHAYLQAETLSTRLYLKQINARLQNQLTQGIEPWLAVALTHGDITYPDNLRVLLHETWRDLLKNQARAILGGYADDVVSETSEIRAAHIDSASDQILDRALDALPGTPLRTQTASETTTIMVWNGHNWPVQQVVSLGLTLQSGQQPQRLLSPDQRDEAFVWDKEAGKLQFLADVPPVGYAAYTLVLGDAPTDAANSSNRYNSIQISNKAGSQLLVEHGRLTWRHFASGSEISDLLGFYDVGDAGDAYNYSPPQKDWLEQANLVGTVEVEETALYQRLHLHHRMRIAPELRPDRSRERGLRLLELMTEATFYYGINGVFFRTQFTNTANDHRLRAHLKTGLHSDLVLADTAFGMVERPVTPEGQRFPTQPNMEGQSSSYPMQTLCAVEASDGAMALVSRGLPEFEAVQMDSQTTLALTLVRAVGWRSRDDLRTRTAAIGPVTALPGAQSLRAFDAEYAIVPVATGDHSEMLRAGANMNAPLQAFQYAQAPETRRHSYLTITAKDGSTAQAIMSALKPPEKGRGWIVRLFNPEILPVELHIVPDRKPRGVRQVNLAEAAGDALEIGADGGFDLTIEPHKIVTLHIAFG